MTKTYEPVIGLEIHCQLKTKSKMFCGCDNQSFAEASDGKCSEVKEPNTVTCPVCMGMPGTLPVANKQALEWTFLLGLALNSKPAGQFNFERKQYFYPDLPKGYQITSQTTPPLVGGYLELEIGGKNKKFAIEHIHLEEDAGKLIHKSDHSLVDLNRAGTPLLEIVTDPCFFSPQEAKAFMQELRLILRYLGISDADMEKGHLRCDANISMREKGIKELGKKTEVKNMNSFVAMEKALEFEIERQTELLEKGEEIMQETRGWDENKGITVSQRSKEHAHDYRYFPEPDLPPIIPAKAFDLKKLEKEIPELPAEKREKYKKKYKIGEKEVNVLVGDIELAEYFEEAVDMVKTSEGSLSIIKKIANLILGDVLAYLNANGKTINEFKINEANIWDLATKLESGEISSRIGKEVFAAMAESGKSADEIISAKGIKQVSDTGELEKIASKIIKDNPKQVEQYKAGKTETMNWFVGQVMKETKGQANAEVVNGILKKMLK